MHKNNSMNKNLNFIKSFLPVLSKTTIKSNKTPQINIFGSNYCTNFFMSF
jgi:hypothetical protein